MIIRDNRMEEIRMILKSLVPLGDGDKQYIEFMVTRSNILVIVIRDTAIYTMPLLNTDINIFAYKYTDIENLEPDKIYDSYDVLLYDKLENIYINYCTRLENPNFLLIEDLDCRSNPEFERLTSLKSTDNMEFYKMHGKTYNEVYLVPLIGKFPGFNKGDTIDIRIYRIDNTCMLNVMDIYKKKLKRNIKLYFRTMDLMKGF